MVQVVANEYSKSIKPPYSLLVGCLRKSVFEDGKFHPRMLKVRRCALQDDEQWLTYPRECYPWVQRVWRFGWAGKIQGDVP